MISVWGRMHAGSCRADDTAAPAAPFCKTLPLLQPAQSAMICAFESSVAVPFHAVMPLLCFAAPRSVGSPTGVAEGASR